MFKIRANKIIESYENCFDCVVKHVKEGNNNYTVICQEIMADLKLFNSQYLPTIRIYDGKEPLETLFPNVAQKITEEQDTLERTINALVFTGHIILVDFANKIFYKLNLNSLQLRGISDSFVDNFNTSGARDGLIENNKVNVTLIRTRLKDVNLKIENFQVGKMSNTSINILYLEDRVSQEDYKLLKNEISNLHSDCVISISDLEKKFNKNSLVPLNGTSGAPDLLAHFISKGKFCILIDGIPVALVVPFTLVDFTFERIDIQSVNYIHIYNKILLCIVVFVATILPGLLIAFINFHSSNLSVPVLSTIKISRQGIFYPIFFEVLIVSLIFEIYKLVSTRISGISIQNYIILVAGITIGQNTISSGLVGAFIMLITALSYVATHAITHNNALVTTITLSKIFILILCSLYGIFGFTISILLILNYFYNKKSLSKPFLSPLAPFELKFLKKYSKTEN